MCQKARSTFVVTDPSEILGALVGLKDVRSLQYTRHGPDVELEIEQVVDAVRCPSCAGPAEVKGLLGFERGAPSLRATQN